MCIRDSFDRAQAWLDGLPESPAILRRPQSELPTPPPELARRYRRLGWREIDLDFAAQYPPGHAIHRALAALAVGSPIELRQKSAITWRLCDTQGVDLSLIHI